MSNDLPAVAPVEEPGATEGWQPIETAPKDNTERLNYVIITDGKVMADVAMWCPERKAYTTPQGTMYAARPAGWFNVSRSRVLNPTHWMPLPQPPLASPVVVAPDPLHICRQPGFDPELHRCLGCNAPHDDDDPFSRYDGAKLSASETTRRRGE